MIARALRPLLLIAAAAAGGCVRFGYDVTHIEQPVDAATLQTIVPGQDDLATCLRKLGAPFYVWEYRGDGVAMAWFYSDGSGLDLDVSYSLPRQFTGASFSLDLDDVDLPGAVLWFDRDLKLLEWKQGSMRELTAGLRRPSAPVDDTAPDGHDGR